MPRKLSEIKGFVSKRSLVNIQEDPADNSVMGNVKKLYDALKDETDFISKELRDRLETILDAHAGKEDEKTGDNYIENLHPALEAYYMTKTLDNIRGNIPDEKKRREMKNLIEYVSGGLKVTEGLPFKSRITISEEQQRNLDRMERSGKIDAANDRLEEEAQARRDAYKGKSGLNVLDEHKAKVNALPKTFKGEDAAARETEARRQLKEICLDIMATRRSIEAKRNDKSGLAKAEIDADHLHSVRQDLGKNEVLGKFLDNMPYSELRKLAAEGHGGAMEDKFADSLKNGPRPIPENAPVYYMPTAKERIEALQGMMDSQDFRKSTPPGEQRRVYIELMATRAAVGSKRGDKTTLYPKVDPSTLERERQLLRAEPMNTALIRVTEMGERQQDALDAALSGHGGALDDLVRKELRYMAVEKESGYKMQQVDMRYAPTFDQRRRDLQGLIDSNAPLAAKLRATIELGVLDDLQSGYSGDSKISIVDSINRQTDETMRVYGKAMDADDMREFIEDARKNGTASAFSSFELKNPGHIRSVRLINEIDDRLAEDPPEEELKQLAARKMVLVQEKHVFQMNKNMEDTLREGKKHLGKDEALLQAGKDDLSADEKYLQKISEPELSKNVSKLMKSGDFTEMCEALGPEKLLQQAKGDGAALLKSYVQVLDGTLKPEPKVNAVKNGPEKDAALEGQAQGFQPGGH